MGRQRFPTLDLEAPRGFAFAFLPLDRGRRPCRGHRIPSVPGRVQCFVLKQQLRPGLTQVKQTSLDSVHEKNVRHGHISTLHIWPARRPLAACRAALIATLLPDPSAQPKPAGMTDAQWEAEVKGRAGTGDVEVLRNEWARALNMGKAYWLYVVYDCAAPKPRLVRVQNPFDVLLAKAKGSVLINPREILTAGTD